MGKVPRPIKVFLLSLAGVASGVAYYYIYARLFPALFSQYNVVVPYRPAPETTIVMAVFIMLGVIERVLPPVPASAFRILSKVIGSAYLYWITNGGALSGTVKGMNVTINVSILVYLIMGFTILLGLMDAVHGIVSSRTEKVN
jgi:hypothetical protein